MTNTDSIQEVKLTLGRVFSHNLNNFNTSIKFIYNHSYSTKEILILSVSKYDEGNLQISYSIGEKEPITKTISTSHRKFLFHESEIVKGCINYPSNCPIIIEVGTSRIFISSEENLEFEIALLLPNNNSNPTFIKHGTIRFDGVFPFQYGTQSAKKIKYQYYYTGIDNNQSAEIVIDFKRGNGLAVAKMVRFDEIDFYPEFDERVEMPKVNSLGLLKFDYFNKKFVITEQQTQKCVPGCEIFIGVYTMDESMYFNLNEYSILFRYDDTIVKLPVNEYTFGSLSNTEREDEYDYYATTIHKDTDRIIIDFDSELCAGYVKLGITPPSKSDYDWYFDNSVRFFTIYQNDPKLKGSSFLGQTFTVAISTKTLDGAYSSFYTYKMITPDRNMPTIIEITTGHNQICDIENGNDRCYFNIPLYSYDYVNSMYLYALNEKSNSDVEIYARIVEMEKYHSMSPQEILKILPSEKDNDLSSSNQFNKELLYLEIRDNSLDYMIFVTVKSSKPGEIHFLSTFHNAPLVTTFHPNSYEMFYVSGTYEVNFNVLGNNIYYVETVKIRGKGEVSNTKNKYVTMLSPTDKEKVSMTIRPEENTIQLSVKGKGKNNEDNFVFYVYYKARTEEGNFDKITYGDINHVEYINNFFPVSYYIPVEEEDNDIIINVSFSFLDRQEKEIEDLGDERFDIVGVVTNEIFIIERKKNKEITPEAGAIGSLSYDPSLKLAKIFFKKEDIIQYTSIGKKYFYLSLSPSHTNNHSYTRVTTNIIALPYTKATIPRNEYYYSVIKGGQNAILKLDKGEENHTIMDIEFQISNDNNFYSVALNTFDNENDFSKNNCNVNSTNLIMDSSNRNGKNLMSLNIKNTKTVFLCIKPSNETNIKESAFVIKYNTSPEQINHFVLSSRKIFFEKIDKDIIAKIEPIMFINGTIPQKVTYSLRIFEAQRISNEINIDSIYPGIIPDKVYSYERITEEPVEEEFEEEKELSFIVNNYPEGEHYINFIAIAKAENGDEIVSYESVKDFIPHTNSDSSGWKWVLSFSLIFLIGLLMVILLILYKKLAHARNKQKEEAFEYKQISEVSKMKNKEEKKF